MLTNRFCRVIFVFVLCSVSAASGLGLPHASAGPAAQGDPIPLVYGQTVDGRINDEQPVLIYAFDALEGDVITIAMIVTDGNLDPFLVLSDAEGNPLATDENSGGGLNARLTFVIPVGGRYTIQTMHSGGGVPAGGGAFSLNLTAAIDGGEPPVVETPPAEETSPEVTPSETEEGQDQPSDAPTVQGDAVRLSAIEPGATIRDTLDRQVAIRMYWFEAQEGDQITVTPEQLADFQPLLVVYDANFDEQKRTEPGISVRLSVPDNGVYFLMASLPDARSAGGGYGFVFEQSGIPIATEDTIDIAYGQSRQGSIDAQVPGLTYRFRGATGDVVTISMKRAGGDLDSYLYLLDASGQLLYEDNDSGGQNNDALIVYTLPANGEYLIITTRLGQEQGITAGSFLLELFSDAQPPPDADIEDVVPILPDDFEEYAQLNYGDAVQGVLSNEQFLDVYVFLGYAGDEVTIQMKNLDPDPAQGLDPFLILLDDNRIPLAEHDDIVEGEQRDARLIFTLLKTAYYAIVATRYNQEQGISAGPYELTLNTGSPGEETDEPTEEAVRTLLDQLSPSLLESDAPVQDVFSETARVYSFAATAGTLVDVSVTTDPGLDSVLILADENLAEVISSGTGALTGVEIPETGPYFVILASRFGPVEPAGGGYILALTQAGEGVVSSPDEIQEGPQQIAYGDTVSGTINDDIVSRLYTFTGSEGDTVRITMEAAPGFDLDSYLELQDSSGNVIDANDDINPGVIRDSRITIELPADGDYKVLASRYVGEDTDVTSGDFDLTLALLTEEDLLASGVNQETIPITYGQSLTGEINDNQYLVFYVFDGEAGDVVSVLVDHLSGNLDSVLHLYQASGDSWVLLITNDDSPTGGTYEALLDNIVLPETTKYLIAISRYGLSEEATAGAYSLTLTRQE